MSQTIFQARRLVLGRQPLSLYGSSWHDEKEKHHRSTQSDDDDDDDDAHDGMVTKVKVKRSVRKMKMLELAMMLKAMVMVMNQ